MTERTLSQQIADFAVSSSYDTLPVEVIESVRGRVLDILGICVAASELETSKAATEWVRRQGGAPQATAIGISGKVPASGAAFVNGVLAHSLDYDDTHLPSVLHPSASVIPTGLAVAEAVGADGKALIHAIAIGIEVCVRIGMAGYDENAGNSTFFEHGQHATSITGAMGSAVTAALLMGADAKGIADTLGVTASMAAGIIESNRTGGTVKRMHCGWAARAAVSAAELVELGFTGPPTVLEGRFGFFEAWLHGTFDAEQITAGLGTEWCVPDIFFKPYPANHFTHAAIDAALALRADGIVAGDIESIEMQTATATLRTIGEPIAVKRAPETGYMAQFSAPFVIAAALEGGSGLGLGLDDFTDERAHDKQLRSIMQKVTVVPSAECDAIFPHQFPGVLKLTTTDGRVIEKRVLENRGGPGRPLSFEELALKFHNNADRVLTETESARMKNTIGVLETLTDVGAVFVQPSPTNTPE